ncbi:unnamed protein product [Lupinus luteus]|uniref:Uncharacterized protein n=1 Tax=Lupinus luteus TaxID=3873 RepID=A0AAV1XY00_LUPLU
MAQKHSPPGAIHFYQILQSNNPWHDSNSQGTTICFETIQDQYFTLDSSSPPPTALIACDSPSRETSISSNNRIPLSPQQGSQSSDITYGTPISGYSSSADDDATDLKHRLRELEMQLLGPDASDTVYTYGCCLLNNGLHGASPPNPIAKYDWNQIAEMIPKLKLREVLMVCAQAVSDDDIPRAVGWMDNVLRKMVSVSGDPIQRLGAYLLEGLRARLESSGSVIYKSLKCEQASGNELMSYMHMLYKICPYWKFAYISSNAVIAEAMENESMIHIIDFQIAQGTQWQLLMEDLARRPGGPPSMRITGIDDSQSFNARGGGLEIVGQRLSNISRSCGVPFEFHGVAKSACVVQKEDLGVRPGEGVAVTFPYVLHHMPDEGVSMENHRDRVLRLVKSLSPKVVSLVEQESNTNTCPFFNRFVETLDYYSAMFESIDVGWAREDKKRISTEQQCVARDIVSMIGCEGIERVERHEVFGKWRSRFYMAGFKQCPMSYSVMGGVGDMLKEFSANYRLQHRDGALYLGWNNRAMTTSSAWR